MLLVLVMIAVIVGTDLLFFRHDFWARLVANVAIALVFLGIYLLFIRPH